MQDTLVANQLKLSVLHAAVLNRIAQGFLRDTKDAKRRFLCDRIRDIAMDKVNLSPILLRQLTTQSLDRRDETKMLQFAGGVGGTGDARRMRSLVSCDRDRDLGGSNTGL